MIYSYWDMVRDGLKLAILGHFLPFYLPKNQKNQNFERMKKTAWDIIILYICTINDNYMIYGSWDAEWDRQDFFVILVNFLPFFLPSPCTKKNIEKMKEYIWGYHKWPSYDAWFLRYGVWQTEFFYHFEPVFAVLSHSRP